jgi:hypothetical protein
MEFGAQNQYGRVIDPSIENFTWSLKKYTFRGQKGENKLSEPKNKIWAKNQYDRVTYPSIGNCTWSKKEIYYTGSKKQK